MSEADIKLDERQHLEALFGGSGGLGFCGCGDPESVYNLVRDILALAPFHQGYETGHANHEKVRALVGGSEGVFYFVLYTLDSAGLIEHGGGIGGAWLSAKGKHYLPLMQQYDWDDIETDDDGVIIPAGLPHEGRGCADVKCDHWHACRG